MKKLCNSAMWLLGVLSNFKTLLYRIYTHGSEDHLERVVDCRQVGRVCASSKGEVGVLVARCHEETSSKVAGNH